MNDAKQDSWARGEYAPRSVIRSVWENTRVAGLVVREVIGWLLLLLGLNVFRISFTYLDNRQVIEAFVAAFMGLFLFRGGLQLVKVVVAARALLRDDSSQTEHVRAREPQALAKGDAAR